MNKKPAISVIIPAYNEEKCLPSCLSAFQKQTFKDFEIIVVDNNSTDKTASIAKKFGARVVKEKHQGMAYSREKGFQMSRAKILARTDADTVVTPNWLEIIYKTFKKYPYVVAITGSWLSSTPKISNRIISAFSHLLSVRLGRLITGHPFLMGPNMAIRKAAWKETKVHTDDTKVHEDIDLSFQLGKVGKILWQPKMKIFFSFRRIEEDPIKGLNRYMGEYPVRFIKTLSLNDERMQKWKKKRSQFNKYLKSITQL